MTNETSSSNAGADNFSRDTAGQADHVPAVVEQSLATDAQPASNSAASPSVTYEGAEVLSSELPQVDLKTQAGQKAYVTALMDLAKSAKKGEEQAHLRLRLALAGTSALAVAVGDFEKFFAEEALAKDKAVPISKRRSMAAVVTCLDLDTSKDHGKKEADRNALVCDELIRVLRSRPDLDPTKAESITLLAQMVKDNGGVAAWSMKLRAPVGKRAQTVVELDPERQKEITAARTSLYLEQAGNPDRQGSGLGYYETLPGGNVLVEPLPLPPSVQAYVLAAIQLISDRKLDTLGEIMRMSHLLSENKTTYPIMRYGREVGFRLATRQLLMLDTCRWVVTQILTRANIVVVCETKHAIVDQPARLPLRAHTSGRRKAEANIADRRRRAVFDLAVVPSETVTGPQRIKLTTQAAKAEKDRSKDMGFLLQDVTSDQGNYPIILDPNAFTPKAEGVFAVGQFENGRAYYLPLLRKVKDVGLKRIEVEASNEGWKISDGKGSTVLAVASHKGQKATFGLMGQDLINILEVLGGIQVSGSVSYEIDPDGLVRLRLATSLAGYDVFVPTVPKGENNRCDRGLIRYSPPDKAACDVEKSATLPSPNQAAPAVDAADKPEA